MVADIRSFARGGNAAIISTVSGDANLHFYRELAQQGVRADKIPVMSLTITEAELPALMRSNLTGHLVAWSYLQAFDRRENRDFLAAWRRFTGRADAVTNDPMEATWIGFHCGRRRSRRPARPRSTRCAARSPAAASMRRPASR